MGKLRLKQVMCASLSSLSLSAMEPCDSLEGFEVGGGAQEEGGTCIPMADSC